MVQQGRTPQRPVTGSPSLQEQADLLRSFRNGFQAAHVIVTGVQLGLFGQLAAHPQGITYQELAKLTDYHPPYLRIWCSTAYHYHLLEADQDRRYRLAPHMDSLLTDRSSPDNMATVLVSTVTEQGPRMAHYQDYIKSGQEGSHAEAYGRNPTRLDPPKNQEALHYRMWVEKMLPNVPELGEILGNGGRLLDIGCGPGLLLLQLTELYPATRLVGIDVVEVGGLNTAQRLIQERGLESRITVELMKVEEMSFHEEFDAIVMTLVFHEILPVELREAVFAACYRALKRPGVLLVRDPAYPGALEEFRDPRYDSGVFTQYQEMTWGTVLPTQRDRHSALTKVGFKPVEHHFVSGPPQGMHYLDVARKA